MIKTSITSIRGQRARRMRLVIREELRTNYVLVERVPRERRKGLGRIAVVVNGRIIEPTRQRFYSNPLLDYCESAELPTSRASKYLYVALRPSSSLTLGSQSRAFRAFEMSGTELSGPIGLDGSNTI